MATNNTIYGFLQDNTALGNNLVDGNGTDTSGTITLVTGT